MQRLLKSISCGIGFLLCSGVLWFALPAQAGSIFGFDNITNNDATNAATGEAQLFVEVQAVGATQVSFRFYNEGPLDSSITDVYFEDGTLFSGIAAIIDADQGGGDPGVDFSAGASPGDLPGANNANPDFQATAGLTADSDAPTQPNGVNPNEQLTIVFNLLGGVDFADTLSALTNVDGLRIGIHVQGFDNGGSESFVNNPNPTGGGGGNPVPEPSTMLLFGSGLVALGWWGRKKQSKKN